MKALCSWKGSQSPCLTACQHYFNIGNLNTFLLKKNYQSYHSFRPLSEQSSSLINNTQKIEFNKKRLVINKIQRLMSEDITSRRCLFLVGPDGCGKTQTMIQVMEKIEKANIGVPIYLDFEMYFLKTREEINNTQIPIDFDHFAEYCVDQICIKELIKCIKRANNHFGISDLMRILMERNNVNYYFLKRFITSRQDIKSIVENNAEIQYLLEHLIGSHSQKEIIELVEKICEKLPYYDCKISNAVRFSIDLLAFIELGSGQKQRTGIEVVSFFFSTLEYFAYKPHFGVKPKLFINGFNLLEVFSKSVSLLSRNDIRQYQSEIPEEVFSSDERGANLHDMILLRISAMYLDAFIPTIIEVAGNYYNYQMIPELKMDTDQVTFIEMIEDEVFESKLQYSALFDGCNFETIHDIVGGNPSKIRTFFEKYYTPKLIGQGLSLVDSNQLEKRSHNSILSQAVLNYLDGEKDHYERKLHVAFLLAARYLALHKAEKKNIKTVQEFSIDDYQVQFTIHDAIEKIMSLKGRVYHFNEEFDPFIQTIGGSILLNSELMYYQIHDNVFRPYDQSYYSYFAKTLEDLESKWSFVQYWYYRLVWQPLNGIKHVDKTLGKHASKLEREDESRHVSTVQP